LSKQAVIIGAGPAGLTAAYELITRTDIKPIVLEASDVVGGISKTVNYKGNRIDIGGHRFFSKSDRVMSWWTDMLPQQHMNGDTFRIAYQGKERFLNGNADGPHPDDTDQVMLVRPRKSRIYYLRKFFDYPLRLSLQTVSNLGPARMARIVASYCKSRLFPIKQERSLKDFLINRFGYELYSTFFQSYTEKVWGVPCNEISASWGAQRIKGLSIGKAVRHALTAPFRRNTSVSQKGTETSLIERFLYPKLGPGQMWETCAAQLVERGGELHFSAPVTEVRISENRVCGVTVSQMDGTTRFYPGDYVFSSMPVRHLISCLRCDVPDNVREVSDGLKYRDFITVGLLVRNLRVYDTAPDGRRLLKDNWIYIQEPDVKLGRLQIFNNWSPYLIADPSLVWLGLEYFCDEGDELWNLRDEELTSLGARELEQIGIIDSSAVLDSTVIRVPKTYPAYFGTYDRFDEIRNYLDGFENLFLIGRNGMHRYNNQDHSMLTAMTAVDNIIAGRVDKENIWGVNTEEEYHESHDENRAAST
jgi:protoporphyrinogen oxidase